MNRILVCLDASPRAPLVLAAATDLARRTGARITLLRAVGIPPEIDEGMLGRSAENIVTAMISSARMELEALAKDIPEALLEGTNVRVGVAWDQICEEASSIDCDLVVIGSHGYTLVDRVLGTTAAKVVNHCDRSVLVVR